MANRNRSSKKSERLRAAIYARVSSKQQAEAKTIASQIEALKARVLADGLELEPELSFVDEGYSGGTLLRPALERLRDQAAAGTFDRVYVHSPDRLSRSYPYQVLLVEELQRYGVEIAFLNHDIGRSPEENLLLQVQGVMAEYERAKILERSRRGKRHAAKAGVVNVLGGAPYGYRYIGKYDAGGLARYEIVEAQAEVVRQIFAWIALDRCSIGQVCRQLQDREIPSPRGKNYWDRTTVWGILKNSAYVGQARFGKTRVGPKRPRLRGQRGKPAESRKDASVYDTAIEEQIVIAVPAIVEEAIFNAVAEQLTENRVRRRERQCGSRYLLQGLLVCKECGYAYYGKPISHSARKGKTREYAYYRCVGTDAYRFGGQRVCDNRQCRTDLIDQAVWQDVCSLLSDPDRVRREYESRSRGIRKKAGRPAEQLARLIGSVRRGIARLIDSYQEGFLDREEFEPRIRAAKERLAKLELETKAAVDRKSEAQDVRTAINQLESFGSRIRDGLVNADWTTRREIIRSLIRKVEVGKEAIRIEYKVGPLPFDGAPSGGDTQDCGRGDGTALRHSLFRRADQPVLHHPGVQVRPDESEQSLVGDPSGHPIHQDVVVDAIKEFF
jgi:site-specific DNA recombinase